MLFNSSSVLKTISRSLLLLSIASALAVSAAGQTRVDRTALTAAEKNLDDQVVHLWNEALALVGPARGVYVDGYGVVLTVEMNLATAPVNMMHPVLTEAEKLQLRQKKLERIPQLKTALKSALVAAAASFRDLPMDEHVAIAMILPRYSWEDASGIPMQLTVQATRQSLMGGSGSGSKPADQSIQTTEH